MSTIHFFKPQNTLNTRRLTNTLKFKLKNTPTHPPTNTLTDFHLLSFLIRRTASLGMYTLSVFGA